MKPSPSLSVSTALLTDFLCSPIAMRADRMSALVLSLAASISPKATPEQRREIFSLGPLSLSMRRKQDVSADADPESDIEDAAPWDAPCYTVSNGVAVVRIEGSIVKGYDNFTCWLYGCMSTDKLCADLASIAMRADVFGVVLLVRSPGGMATGTPEAAMQIAALAQRKTVVAVTDTMACSAAYWMACAAPTIFTTVSADVGCIGTYIALYDYSKMLEEWGIKLELFKRGKFKAIGVMGNPLDDAAREFLDRDCGRTNDRFLAAVRTTRSGVAASTLEGQWFDGEEAVELGLADEVVASVDDVVARMQFSVAAQVAAPRPI
jgi:signal peptide peptidase SppA